ncbi:MAG: hypothetical protein Hyperionvirus12_20 [Hyperionvirus sp.]|uniref:Uncharacterized protein n=1 Tax=Hyperionvirus sp. TaxID=2487770 RepID=A0A3G5AD50_9VIRU|nr:MAG: hypothetical protein Hyperionvirus12_20 [Hyperionvirus sp.]
MDRLFVAEGIIHAIGGAAMSFLSYCRVSDVELKMVRRTNFYEIEIARYGGVLFICFEGDKKYVEANWNKRVCAFSTIDDLLKAIVFVLNFEGEVVAEPEEVPHYVRKDLRIMVEDQETTPTPYPSPMGGDEEFEEKKIYEMDTIKFEEVPNKIILERLAKISDGYINMMIPKINGAMKRLEKCSGLSYTKINVNPFQQVCVQFDERTRREYSWDLIHYGPHNKDVGWFARDKMFWANYGILSPFEQLQQFLQQHGYRLIDVSHVPKYVNLRLYTVKKID